MRVTQRLRPARRASGISGIFSNQAENDGATQQAAQAFKTLESHKTRWVLYPARAKKTVAIKKPTKK